jgi:putative transposase
MTKRAYKFRFYPNATQRHQLAVDFGCARWVWNRALGMRSDAYRDTGQKLSGVDISRVIPVWKWEEAPWLAVANSVVLTQALRDQDTAFVNFFAKRARYPKFKRRDNVQSVRYQIDQRRIDKVFTAGENLVLPKLGEIDVRWSRVPTGVPKMATVSKDACGRYHVAFACDEEISALPETAVAIGIDLGVKDVLVGSNGWKSGNPRHLGGKLRRLRRYQRVVARRPQKGSNRRKRAVAKVARMHARITDARRDWTQKRTTEIVRRADVIALEDLNVKGMVRNRSLARVISDAGLGEVRRQIEYKAGWYGRQVLICGRFDPSSKTCSECGSIQQEMPLAVRVWTCPDCAATHDRDTNAARNVLRFATGGRPGSHARGGQNPQAPVHVLAGMLVPGEARTARQCAGGSHG